MVETLMILRWLVAILLLPVMAMAVIPAAVLLLFSHTGWRHALVSPADPQFWLGLLLILAGLALGVWSAGLFARFGSGTAAPWDPPRHFVVRGPYRYVRNPMLTGVTTALLGEALVLKSWPLLIWFVLFAIANSIYMPLVEEKGLARRFGQDYLTYCQHVPRWIPRTTPWQPPGHG